MYPSVDECALNAVDSSVFFPRRFPLLIQKQESFANLKQKNVSQFRSLCLHSLFRFAIALRGFGRELWIG